MLIIADSRMPAAARDKIAGLGEVLWLDPQPTVYPGIAAHPDIFFCQLGKSLICSPMIPNRWRERLLQHQVDLIDGSRAPGNSYPSSARYNAVITNDLFVHNNSISDEVLTALAADKTLVNVNQGYTRCNLFPLTNSVFITSDRGIEKVLLKHGKTVVFINPVQVVLPGHKHGFIGGCFGKDDHQLVFCGSLDALAVGDLIRQHAEVAGLRIISLFDGPPTDTGSIFFVGE